MTIYDPEPEDFKLAYEQDYEGLEDYPDVDDDAYAAEAVREYHEKRIREWYLREEKNAATEAYQEGDTQPNATEYDCGYHTVAGACVFANTDHCEGCPYRQAIGDTAR